MDFHVEMEFENEQYEEWFTIWNSIAEVRQITYSTMREYHHSPCCKGTFKHRTTVISNSESLKCGLDLQGKCQMHTSDWHSLIYYPTELNNAFWLAKSRSIWRRMDRSQRKVEIWQEKVLNRIINRIINRIRNCLVVPFVKKWTSVGTWMDLTAFVPFCSDVSPFFPEWTS